jgi:hydroxymethylglutaryl-CoA lyase
MIHINYIHLLLYKMNEILKKYPSCYNSLTKFIDTNEAYANIYNMIKPKLFDVSLRDGLQNIKKDDISKYTTEDKIKLYNQIILTHNPAELEVGSIVSKNYFPIFCDSLELYTKLDNTKNNYLLIPSSSKLKPAIDSGCNNFSFISSVSESFQKKNTNKSIEQTKNEILEMMNEIFSNPSISNPKVKIYLSCVNTCPIEGQISNDYIKNQIIYYNNICKPDIICLSDTCANLSYDDFSDIITKANKGGVSYEKMSLHLHVDLKNKDFYSNLQKIFNDSMDKGITKFDISFLESGGCTMTLGNTDAKPNLSYELYYRLLVDYIISKV